MVVRESGILLLESWSIRLASLNLESWIQTKSLIQLQQEKDAYGKRYLTCYIFPQQATQDRTSKPAIDTEGNIQPSWCSFWLNFEVDDLSNCLKSSRISSSLKCLNQPMNEDGGPRRPEKKNNFIFSSEEFLAKVANSDLNCFMYDNNSDDSDNYVPNQETPNDYEDFGGGEEEMLIGKQGFRPCRQGPPYPPAASDRFASASCHSISYPNVLRESSEPNRFSNPFTSSAQSINKITFLETDAKVGLASQQRSHFPQQYEHQQQAARHNQQYRVSSCFASSNADEPLAPPPPQNTTANNKDGKNVYIYVWINVPKREFKLRSDLV